MIGDCSSWTHKQQGMKVNINCKEMSTNTYGLEYITNSLNKCSMMKLGEQLKAPLVNRRVNIKSIKSYNIGNECTYSVPQKREKNNPRDAARADKQVLKRRKL